MSQYKTDVAEYMFNIQEQLVSLKNKKESVLVPDLEEIVINLACLEILGLRRNGIYDPIIESKIIDSLIKAASQLVPQYNESHAEMAKIHIPMNCNRDGMWDHLKKYYLKNFNTPIQ